MILQRDGGLIGEGANDLDILRSEGTSGEVTDTEGPDHPILNDAAGRRARRDTGPCSIAARSSGVSPDPRVRQDIGCQHGLAVPDRETDHPGRIRKHDPGPEAGPRITREGDQHGVPRAMVEPEDGGDADVEDGEDGVCDPLPDFLHRQRLGQEVRDLGQTLGHPPASLALGEEVGILENQRGLGAKHGQELDLGLAEHTMRAAAQHEDAEELSPGPKRQRDRRLGLLLDEPRVGTRGRAGSGVSAEVTIRSSASARQAIPAPDGSRQPTQLRQSSGPPAATQTREAASISYSTARRPWKTSTTAVTMRSAAAPTSREARSSRPTWAMARVARAPRRRSPISRTTVR